MSSGEGASAASQSPEQRDEAIGEEGGRRAEVTVHSRVDVKGAGRVRVLAGAVGQGQRQQTWHGRTGTAAPGGASGHEGCVDGVESSTAGVFSELAKRSGGERRRAKWWRREWKCWAGAWNLEGTGGVPRPSQAAAF